MPGGSRKVYHTYTMEYGGTTICIRRKKVKYLYLRVKKDGQVVLTAPLSTPEDAICHFAQEKLPWISQQQDQWKLMQESIQPHTYETGDQFILWGEPYTLVLEEGKKQFRLENGKIYLTVPSESTLEKRSQYLKEAFRQLLLERLTQRLPFWQEKMGLYPNQIQVRDMRSRWGSCQTQKKQISFSLGLVTKPQECVDYVMVHELAHLAVPDHSARFWAVVEQWIPDWKERRKRLNQADIG